MVKYEYTGGTNQAPTAFLFGSDVSYTLYQQNDKGAWKKVTDSNATLLGHYKVVVDASGMNGFTVSHTSFYFDIVKIKDKVTFENKPLPDGSEDKDNNMGWPTINNGEKSMMARLSPLSQKIHMGTSFRNLSLQTRKRAMWLRIRQKSVITL